MNAPFSLQAATRDAYSELDFLLFVSVSYNILESENGFLADEIAAILFDKGFVKLSIQEFSFENKSSSYFINTPFPRPGCTDKSNMFFHYEPLYKKGFGLLELGTDKFKLKFTFNLDLKLKILFSIIMHFLGAQNNSGLENILGSCYGIVHKRKIMHIIGTGINEELFL